MVSLQSGKTDSRLASHPNTSPFSAAVRPSYMCKSLPQMHEVVTLMIASSRDQVSIGLSVTSYDEAMEHAPCLSRFNSLTWMLDLRHWNFFYGYLVKFNVSLHLDGQQPQLNIEKPPRRAPFRTVNIPCRVRHNAKLRCISLESVTSHFAPASPFIISGCDIVDWDCCRLLLSLLPIDCLRNERREEKTHLTCYAVSNLVSLRGQLAWRPLELAPIRFAGRLHY